MTIINPKNHDTISINVTDNPDVVLGISESENVTITPPVLPDITINTYDGTGTVEIHVDTPGSVNITSGPETSEIIISHSGATGPMGQIEETFETVSKNLKSLNYGINRNLDENIDNIVYTQNGDVVATKSFTYDADRITEIVINKQGFNVRKVFNFNIDGDILSVEYIEV